MGNSLVNSMVRGFGFTLGRRAANSLVNKVSDTQPISQSKTTAIISVPEEIKLNWLQKILVFIVHLSIVFLLALVSKAFGSNWVFGVFNVLYFLLGWTIFVSIFSKINEKKYLPIIQQQKEELFSKIEHLRKRISESPFPGWAGVLDSNNRYIGTWEETKNKYTLPYLKIILDTFTRRITFLDKNIKEFGLEKFKEITGLDEPIIGMTEREFILWKTNEDELLSSFTNSFKYEIRPTNVEESVSGKNEYKTLVYGTKKTGSYFKFKNGLLESYTIRD